MEGPMVFQNVVLNLFMSLLFFSSTITTAIAALPKQQELDLGKASFTRLAQIVSSSFPKSPHSSSSSSSSISPMGRLTAKPFPDFPQLPIREVELSLQLDVAGKLVYLLSATVMLFIVLHKLKCCSRRNTRVGGHAHNTSRVNVVRGDHGAHTTEVQIDDEDDTMGSQISGEVGIDVAVDDDDDINNGEIAMTQTSLAATFAFLFN